MKAPAGVWVIVDHPQGEGKLMSEAASPSHGVDVAPGAEYQVFLLLLIGPVSIASSKSTMQVRLVWSRDAEVLAYRKKLSHGQV